MIYSKARLRTLKDRLNLTGITPTKHFYVYFLCRADGSPYYIGKGAGQRALEHLRFPYSIYCQHEGDWRRHTPDNNPRYAIPLEVWEQGKSLEVRFVYESDDEEEAYAEETRQIELHREALHPTQQRPGGGGKRVQHSRKLERHALALAGGDADRAALLLSEALTRLLSRRGDRPEEPSS